MDRAVRLALLASALALQGCYSHVAVRAENVPVGERVRARVSAAQAEQLGPILGRENRVLLGRVVGEDAGGLLLQVPSLGASPGQRLSQRVSLPASEILELEVRKLDRTRTAGLLVALAAVGGYVAVRQFDDGSEDPPSPEKPGGGAEQAILGVRFSW